MKTVETVHPPSRLARLVATPYQTAGAAYTKRAPQAKPVPGTRRLPKLSLTSDVPAVAAEPETRVTPAPPAKARKPSAKRVRKGGSKPKLSDDTANGLKSEDNAATAGKGASTETAHTVASPAQHLSMGAPFRDSVTSADLKPWDTEIETKPPTPPPPIPASDPAISIPAPAPAPALALAPPVTAPAPAPAIPASATQPAAFTPYKPRRPTPPMQVSTNISALRKNDGEGAEDEPRAGGDKDSVASLPGTAAAKSKFTGRNRTYSFAGGEEDVKKRRASFAPGMKKFNASSKFDMDSLRKRRESNLAPHRAGLEEGAKEDFLSSLVKDMNVMDEDSKLRYIRMSEPIFKDNDLISIETLGAELTRMKWITAGEVDYITKVFELVAGDYVDQSEFCVIAALAERMTYLDTSLRQSFGDTDFRKLEVNIKQYRHLFTVNTSEEGKMTYDDLKILLLSTGLPANSIEGVASLLNLAPAGKDPSKQSEVGFLDFLSYVPFFALLHSRIVDDPLAYNAGDEDAAGGEAVVKKLLADMKSRADASSM
ncbi:hypothetical protein HDU86_007296 [Geranomyces michiganensis]|nr:hypothetical protein HDU86_007296 [Geranomyces michiganensis]